MITKEVEVKEFAKSLRNILYLAQILKYNIEWFKGLRVTPPNVKDAANRMLNGIKYFEGDCMTRGSRETWDAVKSDLSNDNLNEISLLLDTVSHIKNIEEVRLVIEAAIADTKEQKAA
jgi:Xaa-Pro aminopeptidase